MSASLLVSNLAAEVTEAELRNFFSEVGVCRSVHIMKHHKTRVPRGFAFVQMQFRDVNKAVRFLATHELRGRALRVDFLMERVSERPATRAPRRAAARI